VIFDGVEAAVAHINPDGPVTEALLAAIRMAIATSWACKPSRSQERTRRTRRVDEDL
jgi:hypothetical protein